MKRANLSEQAEENLQEILAFIARDNSTAADRHVNMLIRKCQKLAEFHGMAGNGRSSRRGRVDFRSTITSIYHRETEFDIDVIRILSGFRDIPARFEIA